ncbi:highly reducing polyketide synthase PKS6-like [Sphaeramia orbicularis]|uniref:Highly reducing polyketide synthase PKS6-like n=1 Tax=Sphaeramia orbicularis TaxID=375764 RepID=A0A672Z194_9TELE|nr:highly reducing polyketide synthase PKS6-like [Sphaeramia orbicularis]
MEESEDDIAVIGIGCNFPGGEGIDNFWRILSEGRNCVTDIPAERFDSSFWYDPDDSKPGKTQTNKAALIDGFNEFDHKFFGITKVEADCMDPQQKLLLQCAYRALEDAGISMESISGSRTGVIIGLMNRDYEMLISDNPTTISHYNATGTATSVAANRISFTFNLTGPSFAIDSACSSSLVALHLACQAIKQGDCEMVLCGGVSCIIEPRVFVALSKAKMISPDGTSKPFSISADGYGRGEGCGILLLKRLKNAVSDCNKIWGVISKTAVNQDGRSVTPITKPSMAQQEELLRQIYTVSDLADVQYIEAHGTGTGIGDPFEAQSISNVIAKVRPSGLRTLRIGSVKGNIGHTESAAGVAGLIKVLLMMKNKTIVPSVFYSEDKASIDTKSLNLAIPTEAERWETNECSEMVAGINSFGFGGTNAHAILKEYKQKTNPTKTPKCCPKLFVISAVSQKSLNLSISDTQQRLCSNNTIDLEALSYTSACGRSHSRHKYRKVFLTSSHSDLQCQLASASKIEPTKADMKVVFVFCGNGVAYSGMCKHLMRNEVHFRDKITEIDSLFKRYTSISISQKLAGNYEEEDLTKPHVVQPLLFAIQVGIATLLKQWGVKPDAVLGHSIGEVAAAHCSGLLSLEDAVKVIHHRSALQSKVTGGKMLVVSNVDVENVLKISTEFSGKICVAAFNSPQSCTLSGHEDAIDTLHQRLGIMFADKNVFLHVLDVPTAHHSHMMDPILDEIEKSIDSLHASNMECKLFSTVTGERHSAGNFCTGSYWARNVREPVLFEQTLHAVSKDMQSAKNVVFVEIAPRRALHRNIKETLGNDSIILSSVQPEKDYETMLFTVAKLFEKGINLNWNLLYKGCETIPTKFPVYQFDNVKNELSFEVLRKGNESFVSSSHSLITHMTQNRQNVYNLTRETLPYIWEHKNNGVSIVPGSFYVELAYASLMASLRPKKPISLLQLSIRFQNLLALSSNSHQLNVTLGHAENETTFKIQSTIATHASGTYRCTDDQPLIEEPCICLSMISKRCKSVIQSQDVYLFLSKAGFEYGSIFKHLNDVHFGDEFKEAITTVKVPGELLKHLHDCFIHPVLLDYFLQMTAVVALKQLSVKKAFPSAIGSVVISAPLQEHMVMYLRAAQETPDFIEVCGCFSNIEGKVLVELTGVRISFLDHCTNVPQSLFFHNEVIPIAEVPYLPSKIKAIIFEDELGVTKALRPYIHPESITVGRGEHWTSVQLQDLVLKSLKSREDFKDVLFIWGVEDLGLMTAEKMLELLVNVCVLFQHVVLALKESQCSCTVRVITYRSTEVTVNYISPSFTLSGLTRACAVEMTGLSFQLIDLASLTSENTKAAVHVINNCKQQEVIINKGQIFTPKIARTPTKDSDSFEGKVQTVYPTDFVLQTSDPYKMTDLSAKRCVTNENVVLDPGSVEVQLTNVCVHSADYFPVSTSHLKYGQTLYWNRHTSQNHKLVALDFSGIVTTVGRNVQNLKEGDHIASCYPVASTSKIIIPEAVCYNTKRLPFLKENPCMSYFILAWEILHRKLSVVKQQHKKLGIISSSPASALMKVLALTANRLGWNVSSFHHFRVELPHFDKSHALVFLPPFDHCCWEEHDNGVHGRHVVFVCTNHMSSHSSKIFASKSENMHVHEVHVVDVLQKANLRAQSRNIFNWLTSLGFGIESLPLKRETFQSNAKEPNSDRDAKSYFTTKIVQQVVLDHRESNCPKSDIRLLSRPRQLFKQSCVYIVTGGCSGLGSETVKFIAQNGGGCIVTLSRSIPTDKMQLEMEHLQERYGVKVMNLQCDVSVSAQVVNAISQIEERFSSWPVKGVFHSAAVLHDALIETLDWFLFQKVMKPKVGGVLNLHYATLHYKLDYFVCYSSISSFIGNASQCNYAAANSFLDMFCHYRRNIGLVGQCINWGPLNLGLLLNKKHFQKFLEAKGMMTMDVWEVHEALRMCLMMNRPQQVICKFNFKNLHIHVLSQNMSLRERLSALVQTELEDVSNECRSQNFSSTTQTLRAIISDITNVSVDDLDDDSTLAALGIDSMLAMTLQNKIFQETTVNVPLVKILDPNTTVAGLVKTVQKKG